MGGDSGRGAEGDVFHQVGTVGYSGLGKTNDVDVVFVVLPCEELGFVVEKVVEFSAVYLVEREVHFEVVTIFLLFENVLGCQKVEPPDWPSISQHGVGLATAGLSVSEAGDLGPVEGAVNQRSHSGLVDLASRSCTY